MIDRDEAACGVRSRRGAGGASRVQSLVRLIQSLLHSPPRPHSALAAEVDRVLLIHYTTNQTDCLLGLHVYSDALERNGGGTCMQWGRAIYEDSVL